MARVTFSGWKPGFNKVRLNGLLRERTGMSLAEAKQTVDRILAGEEISVSVPDDASAERLARDASELGANCRPG